jgi:spore germination cell wall hydrolase CwlJ-like protein
MRVLHVWAQGAVMALALSGMAHADVAASQPSHPDASVDSRLTRLLGVERTAFTSITPNKLEQIITPPTTVVRKQYAYPEPKKLEYRASWLSELPDAEGGKQWQCLAKAVYFESRGEPVKGQFGVDEVVMNRVDSAGFPDTVCAVVNQGAHRRNACQFSFACDGAAETIHNEAAYERAGKIYRLLLDGAPRKVTDGATYFHTRWVHPSWSHHFKHTTTVGAHLFYRVPSRVAAK